MKNYSVDWFSGNIPNWNSIFEHYLIKDKENIQFLEIGCFEGKATNYLLENVLTHETAKIHVIDTFNGSRDEPGMNWDENYDFDELYNIFINNTNEYKDKIIIHRGLSGDILKKDFEKNSFDFIYVDGSHTAYDVLQDAILCHPILKPSGIIIFDDYLWKDPNNMHPTNSPQLGINCFMSTYENQYDCIMQGYQIGLIKK